MSEQKGIQLVHTKLVRDNWLLPEIRIQTPEDGITAIRSLISDLDREVMAVMHLSTKNRVISASICSVGTMDCALVSPPEIFRTAILAGARRIILLHNHPSGDVIPSREDILITRRLAQAGEFLGVPLLDHIIVGDHDTVFSFARSKSEALSADPAALSGNVAERDTHSTVPRENSKKKLERIRRETVEELLELMREGKSFYDPGWSREAMAPRNPVTGTVYKGCNRLILMAAAMKHEYQDPRWLTRKNLIALGYTVKKGEHSIRLEKWKFTKKQKVLDKEGRPVLDEQGKPVYEEVLLKYPQYFPFQVFNGEQIQDFPPYQPRNPIPQGTEEKVDMLFASADCRISETAQEEVFYRPSCDTIYLPLRSAFKSMESFAATAAHELIHSTGHENRLNREFGSWPADGKPDERYCMEELRAEIGSLFLLNDLQIPIAEPWKQSSAAYVKYYIQMMQADPNILFRAAADAEKGENYLLKRYGKSRKLELIEERIPRNPKRAEQIHRRAGKGLKM